MQELAAPAAPRRRRRARVAEAGAEPAALSLARVTVVDASARFGEESEAESWLDRGLRSEGAIDEMLESALRLLNRALHAHAVTAGIAHSPELRAEDAVVARLGYGSGDQVADGSFTHAREIDPRAGASHRRRRTEELRPQERMAAVLSGRERIDACETLILRGRADLDAGRTREAALQLRVGLEALLVELADALEDPGHTEDMATLESRKAEAVAAASAALAGNLDATQRETVQDLTAICERVLRRRRVLRG